MNPLIKNIAEKASRPVESKSHFFDEMGRNPIESVTRLYFHRHIAENVLKVLEGF